MVAMSRDRFGCQNTSEIQNMIAYYERIQRHHQIEQVSGSNSSSSLTFSISHRSVTFEKKTSTGLFLDGKNRIIGGESLSTIRSAPCNSGGTSSPILKRSPAIIRKSHHYQSPLISSRSKAKALGNSENKFQWRQSIMKWQKRASMYNNHHLAMGQGFLEKLGCIT